MHERLTDRARRVLQLATQEAQRRNHEYVGTEEVLIGMLKEGNGVAAHVLKSFNLDLGLVRTVIERLVPIGPDMVTMGKLPLTPRAKQLLGDAEKASVRLGHTYVGTEHLLLGLIAGDDTVAIQALRACGVSLCDVEREVLALVGQPRPEDSSDSPSKEDVMEHPGKHLSADTTRTAASFQKLPELNKDELAKAMKEMESGQREWRVMTGCFPQPGDSYPSGDPGVFNDEEMKRQGTSPEPHGWPGQEHPMNVVQPFHAVVALPVGVLLGAQVRMLVRHTDDKGGFKSLLDRPLATVVGVSFDSDEFWYSVKFQDGSMDRVTSTAFIVEW